MGIKFVQINKGQSGFYNKIGDIKTIIVIHKPDVLIINEANMNVKDDMSKYQFQGYILEVDQLASISKRIRTVVLIKDNITYKRCKNFETINN